MTLVAPVAATVVVVVAVTFVAMPITTVIPFVMIAIAMITATVTALVLVPLTVVAHVNLVVPIVVDEIHPPIAGVVFMAVAIPVARLARSDMQVYGFLSHALMFNDDRLRVVDPWPRRIAQINNAIEAGLPGVDGNTDIRGQRGRAEGAQRHHGADCEIQIFVHGGLLHGPCMGGSEWLALTTPLFALQPKVTVR
ncbi:hypothetical protein [Sinimarinibacterium sp. CAU 1509]|uniref:hypothetical protein n=1 Tax=Sinimarinibacterium sp. CAU 1509 TaxID=2562283 RepID=UPI001B7F9733|nr:hypothetical protein [Sinimarinibacterium sp. CAU 1509]